jgi:hypothetical protein
LTEVARNPETTFIESVDRHLPVTLYRLKLNLPYSSGVPDKWYSGSAADLWVEYKYLPRLPVRAAKTIDLTSLQRLWLRNRLTEGRRVAVVVGHKSGGLLFTDGAWEAPIEPASFAMLTLTRRELANRIFNITTGGWL